MKQFASFRLDTANECLWRGGVRLALQPKPFAVLRYLVENPGRLITHDELLDALWPETYVQPQVLRTYMLELRKILGDDAAQPRFIQTLPKRGYCFVAPVAEAGEERNCAEEEPAFRATHALELFGKESELARLLAEAEALAGGERRVVLVSGEAGLGKTALADAFSRQAAASLQALVARGQCVQGFGEREEYYPIVEALGHLCGSPGGERACKILASLAPAWLATRERHPEMGSGHVPRERLPGHLCAALEELAADRPLILILEDLQWADAATLDLVAALARRRAPARLMVLATCRPRSVAPDHPFKRLKHELLLHRLCAEIVLAPLTRTAMTRLLMEELQAEALPPGLAGFVFEHSEGNPLFAAILLRHLIAQCFLVCETGASGAVWKQTASFAELEAVIPDELAQIIELEIERLTPAEQRLLEAGSLMNVAFPAWAVAAALEEDAIEVEEACNRLVRRFYFLERAGEDELPDGSRSTFYAFAHRVYREVLYQRQSPNRRARRHLRIAERLGALFAGREPHVAREMALHYEAAGCWQSGVRALCAAARYARQRSAHPEAAELLERALRIAENLSAAEREVEVRAIHDELAGMRNVNLCSCQLPGTLTLS